MATEACINQTGLPFVYDSAGEARDILNRVSDGDEKILKDNADQSRHTGDQFSLAAKDRADQDRYVAREFEAATKDRGDKALYDQKEHTDHERYLALRFDALSKDVERNGRSAELATEKTAAATQLAFKDALRDQLLSSERIRADIAKCCCETEARISASTAAILADLKATKLADLERQLTVFQVRAVPGTGSSPV